MKHGSMPTAGATVSFRISLLGSCKAPWSAQLAMLCPIPLMNSWTSACLCHKSLATACEVAKPAPFRLGVCHAMLCSALLCRAVLHCAMLCCAMLCCAEKLCCLQLCKPSMLLSNQHRMKHDKHVGMQRHVRCLER